MEETGKETQKKMQGKKEYVIVGDHYCWKLLACFVQLGIPSLSILPTTQSNRTSSLSLFTHTLLHGISSTFITLPPPQALRNSASFPQFTEVRPGIQLFSLTNNLVYSSNPPSGIWGHKSCWSGMNGPNTSQSYWSSGKATWLSKNLVAVLKGTLWWLL